MKGQSVLFLSGWVLVMSVVVDGATCPPLTSATVTIKCVTNKGKAMTIVDCKKPMQMKTTAMFQCPENMKISEGYQKVRCNARGKWDNGMVTCVPAGEVSDDRDENVRPSASIPGSNLLPFEDATLQSAGDLASLKVSKTPRLLVEAMTDCEAINSSLIVVDSPFKVDVLNSLFAKSAAFAGATNDNEVWVGIMRNDANGMWTAMSDDEAATNVSELSSFKWGDGCPKSGDANRCAVYDKKSQAHCDIKCENPQKQPYICAEPSTPTR